MVSAAEKLADGGFSIVAPEKGSNSSPMFSWRHLDTDTLMMMHDDAGWCDYNNEERYFFQRFVFFVRFKPVFPGPSNWTTPNSRPTIR